MTQADLISLDGAEAVSGQGAGFAACPGCGVAFTPKRENQSCCDPPCQKRTTRNAARGSREVENTKRSDAHYSRAAWLSYDVLRMSSLRQRQVILAILQAASAHDAALRNILLDPALLGADRWSGLGKLYPDTRSPGALNIAKMVNAFCREEWGVSTRDAILDDGKPAHRRFAEPTAPADPAPPTVWQAQGAADVPHRPRTPRPTMAQGYDWRLVAKAMQDRGWRRYFTTAELDALL
jgi:hypothetical protein